MSFEFYLGRPILHSDLFDSESIHCDAPFRVFVQDGLEWDSEFLTMTSFNDAERSEFRQSCLIQTF